MQDAYAAGDAENGKVVLGALVKAFVNLDGNDIGKLHNLPLDVRLTVVAQKGLEQGSVLAHIFEDKIQDLERNGPLPIKILPFKLPCNIVEHFLFLSLIHIWYICLNISKKGNYLAIRCENPYAGEVKSDRRGKPLTDKADAAAHGYGMRLMEETAKKYGGVLDISSSGGVFRLQTALRLTEKEKLSEV